MWRSLASAAFLLAIFAGTSLSHGAGAADFYQQALKHEPGNADAVHMLGIAAYQLGMNDIAVGALERALTLRDPFPDARGNIHVHVRQSVKEFAQALEVVAMKSQVRGDEIRSWMPGKQMIALGHQRLKRGIL